MQGPAPQPALQPIARWFHCHKAVLQGALRCNGRQNYAESSPEAKRVLCITLLPSCRAAELLCNSPAWRAPRPRHGWKAVRMELHPKFLCASPPSCAQLSPLPDVPLWPLTACQALQGRPALTTRFPRLPGRLTALPRWGTCPLWRLPSSRRNKCPVCAGGREAPVPAVGAAEARTPRLRTMGRQSRGCRLGFARSGGCRARPVPLPSAAWPARCRRLPQAPGGSSSKQAGVL